MGQMSTGSLRRKVSFEFRLDLSGVSSSDRLEDKETPRIVGILNLLK